MPCRMTISESKPSAALMHNLPWRAARRKAATDSHACR